MKQKMLSFLGNSDYRKLVESFLSLSFIRVADFLLPILVLPYLISVIGVEKFGLVAFASSLVVYFLNITQFGFSLSAVRELSSSQKDIERVEQIFNLVNNTKIFLLIISTVVYLAIIVIVPEFKEHLLLYVFSFGLVIGDVLFPKWFFQGIEEMRFITLINFLLKLSYLVLVFLFIKSESDYVFVPLIQSIGSILGGIYSLYIIKKKYKINFFLVSFNAVKREIVNSFSSFTTLIIPTLYSNTSIFLLGAFTNNTFVGYFSGALRISNAFSSFNVILTRTFYPFVNKTKNDIGKINKVILISGFVVTLLMLFSSKYSVAMVLGEDMIKSKPIVMILSLTPVLLSIRTVYGINSLLVKGMDKLYMYIALFSSITGLVMAFVFIPLFSFYGAAIVVVSSQSLYALLSFIYANKKV